MDSDLRARIRETLVEYPDFPKPGVIFQVPSRPSRPAVPNRGP